MIRRLTDSKLAEQPGQPVVVGNLFDPRLNAGGSSGRSAATLATALATDMLPLCTASDDGGSLRIPPAQCGAVVSAVRGHDGALTGHKFAIDSGAVTAMMERGSGTFCALKQLFGSRWAAPSAGSTRVRAP